MPFDQHFERHRFPGLNVQRRCGLLEAMNSPRERNRIERARPSGRQRDHDHRTVAGKGEACSGVETRSSLTGFARI